VTPLEDRRLPSGLVASWIGQDGHDLVGPSSRTGGSGVQDVRIGLSGLSAGRTVAAASVIGLGGGQWDYLGAGANWAADLTRSGPSTGDLFIEPYRVETGRPFDVQVRYDDGSIDVARFDGGAADPHLKLVVEALGVAWAGQDGAADRTGLGPSVGPDGVADARLDLTNLRAGVAVESVRVDGVPGRSWAFGRNREAVSNAELFLDPVDSTRGSLFLTPDRDLNGIDLRVEVVYATGQIDAGTVRAGASSASLRVGPATPAPTTIAGVSASWIGQDGLPWALPGDVHLTLDGLPSQRTITGVVVTDPAGLSWSYGVDPGATGASSRLSVSRDGTRADLAFPPGRDETGGELSVRVVFDDGSIALARVAGGATDLSRRAPTPEGSSVLARPGDDLQALVGRYGTVRLAAGRYELSAPLVLDRPVNLLGDAGAVLVFTQPEDDPAWTTAIKVHAGNTTLDNLAVRFVGPIRWDWDVSYGPAVIGTTDSLDAAPGGTKVNLTFTRLDLEGPRAAGEAWEQSANLFRLSTAESGRIEDCRFKGGMIEFDRGPWRIANNRHEGAQPWTTADAAFAGHDTRDLVLTGNRVEPTDPIAGKLWRFLVLTRTGFGDRVEGNTVIGVGPRDGDAIPHPNAPEIILTESYRVHYEGAVLGRTGDGLIVQVGAAQGEAIAVGAGVAVLDGPSAGSWRRVVQVIDPTTVLLDRALPEGTRSVSIASGFTGLSMAGNRIDMRGSAEAQGLVLVGNHFGLGLRDNVVLGGLTPLRLLASAAEAPVFWGWTHSPNVGGWVEGNTFEGSLAPGLVGVEHDDRWIKSGTGRTYFAATIRNNTLSDATTADGRAAALRIGDLRALDPSETRVSLSGNRGTAQGLVARVDAAVVDGVAHYNQTVRLIGPGRPVVPPPPTPLPAPTGLALSADSGRDAGDGLTNNGLVRFDPVPGAIGYEYRVGADGPYQSIGTTTWFLPTGMTQGVNEVWARAIGQDGAPGLAVSMSMIVDTVPPTTVPLTLDPMIDTGASAWDLLTATRQPRFQAEADAGDLVVLVRNGVTVAWRMGPGPITDPGAPADSTYVYLAVRIDAAGNASVGRPLIITLDTAPPPAPSGLTSLGGGSVRFNPTAPGDVYEYRVGVSGAHQWLGAGTSFTVPAGVLAEGWNLVSVRATDRAGNIGPESSLALYREPDGPTASWLGQDGRDLVGPSATKKADGTQDIHITLKNLPTNRTIVSARVLGDGGGAWAWNLGTRDWAAALVRSGRAATADLYVQPYQRETGRRFVIELTYDNNTKATLTVIGGTAQVSLAMPRATVATPTRASAVIPWYRRFIR
jgi:hypothetical protein